MNEFDENVKDINEDDIGELNKNAINNIQNEQIIIQVIIIIKMQIL